MSRDGYKIRNKEGIHFITFAVTEWIDVFTRKDYRDILLNSIRHCQKERGLLVHAWCVMSNHVHLVAGAKNNDTSDILRDVKKFTSKQILKAIAANEQESRRKWMLDLFRKAGAANSRNSVYQFWRQDNQPKELFCEKFTNQKLDYFHNNPIDAGIVEKAEGYLYSSEKITISENNAGFWK